MGQQHHVVARQSAGVHGRFVLEHVEPGTGDDSPLERVDERGFVDDRTSGGVHEERAGPHPHQKVGIEEVMGDGRVRAVDRHDVAR